MPHILTEERSEESRLQQREQLARYVLYILMLVLPTLAYLDHREGYATAALAELVAAGLSPLILIATHRLSAYRLTGMVTAILIFTMALVVVMNKLQTPITLLWVPILPLLFINLGEASFGLVLTVAYYVIFSWNYFGGSPATYTTHPVANWAQLSIAYAVVAGLTALYDITQRKLYVGLQDLAERDYLTGVMNRRGLMHSMEQVIHEAIEQGTPFSLIIFDLDDFKGINEKFGHGTGDRLLQQLANYIAMQLRSSDHIGRWGGEEFVVMMPHTPLDSASRIADRLNKKIALERFLDGHQVTTSYGVAEYQMGESVEQLVRRVDAAQYIAKHGNPVAVAANAGLPH